MIVAHFTATDGASTSLVFGIALTLLGLRGMTGTTGMSPARGRRFLVLGLVATGLGVVLAFAHAG